MKSIWFCPYFSDKETSLERRFPVQGDMAEWWSWGENPVPTYPHHCGPLFMQRVMWWKCGLWRGVDLIISHPRFPAAGGGLVSPRAILGPSDPPMADFSDLLWLFSFFLSHTLGSAALSLSLILAASQQRQCRAYLWFVLSQRRRFRRQLSCQDYIFPSPCISTWPCDYVWAMEWMMSVPSVPGGVRVQRNCPTLLLLHSVTGNHRMGLKRAWIPGSPLREDHLEHTAHGRSNKQISYVKPVI